MTGERIAAIVNEALARQGAEFSPLAYAASALTDYLLASVPELAGAGFHDVYPSVMAWLVRRDAAR